jgi:hypothetical protein
MGGVCSNRGHRIAAYESITALMNMRSEIVLIDCLHYVHKACLCLHFVLKRN